MKKYILLLLIVFAVPALVVNKTGSGFIDFPNSNYLGLPKDDYWEEIKQTIFNKQYNPEIKLQRHKGPVLISLLNANASDSLVVNKAILELKNLVPHKEIDYFENYTGFNLSKDNNQYKDNAKVKGYSLKYLKLCVIKINFNQALKVNENLKNKKEIETSIDREYTYLDSKELSGLIRPIINIDFQKDSDINKRKRIVEFGLIKVLACKSEFLGMLDMYEIYTESETRLNEVRGLMKKLYKPDVLEGFKAYMYKTYPWRYAINYLNPTKAKLIAIWVNVCFVLVLLWLGFGLLYKRSYKWRFLNYFLPMLFCVIALYYIFLLLRYLLIPGFYEFSLGFIGVILRLIVLSALLALLLLFFDRFFIKKQMPFVLQLLLKVLGTFIVCLTPMIVFYFVESNESIFWVQLNMFFLAALLFSIGRGVLCYFDHFSDNLIKQKDVELSKLKELNAQAEVKRLQSQINPHFLYNALNSIASLAQTDGVKTEKMALSLSDLFKYTINRKETNKSTIKDEVEMVKNYLEVEQIRFGNRLNFSIQVEEDLKTLEIPMFLIQPLIENAVKHGISKIEDNGEITLKIYKVDSRLFIKVSDNGPNFPNGLVSGHGLQTVYDLLELSYGDDASISWKNTPEKEISIIIKTLA